jgi:GAF domain-containing protein
MANRSAPLDCRDARSGLLRRGQIELASTFADHAVIAIENVRLFTELEARNRDLSEALDQQTATSEILRVISSSPTDVKPVFDAIVRSASRLCGGEYAIVTRYDGELMHLAAQYNPRPGLASTTERLYPRPPGRDLPSPRAIIEKAVVHVPDAGQDPDLAAYAARIGGSFLSVPMLREGVPIGAIGVSRSTVGPFGGDQIALLKAFAEPSRHRHRERPPLHGAGGTQPRPHRGAGAADGHQ